MRILPYYNYIYTISFIFCAIAYILFLHTITYYRPHNRLIFLLQQLTFKELKKNNILLYPHIYYS